METEEDGEVIEAFLMRIAFLSLYKGKQSVVTFLTVVFSPLFSFHQKYFTCFPGFHVV